MRADRQSAGYGRRGRAWASLPGNLAASLLWPLDAPLGPEGPAGFGFAAALAVRDACAASGATASRLTLKWPNDVLLDGKKLSGLLIELLTAETRALVIGIGVNLSSAPTGLPYEAASLGGSVAPKDFLSRLDAAFAERIGMWREHGFAALRDAWLAAAQGVGGPITVRLPGETLEGVFEGLGRAGALRLRQGSGLREVTAGDVFFPDQGG